MTSANPRPSATYALRKRLPRNAFGNALFSVGMVAKVPYFGTILPLVTEMEPGYCKVSAPNWFGVHNHIGTVHAIAMCNLAELVGGVMVDASLPADMRWIPKGMSAQYLTKANTRLTATATLAHPIDFATITEGTDVVVSIEIRDTDGIEVVHCDITTWVTPA